MLFANILKIKGFLDVKFIFIMQIPTKKLSFRQDFSKISLDFHVFLLNKKNIVKLLNCTKFCAII